MKLCILGDIHASWKHLSHASKTSETEGVDTIIQLGDLGYFPGCPKYWPPKHLSLPANIKVYWIDGNHENHWRLGENPHSNEPWQVDSVYKLFYWPRGYVLSIGDINILGIGGSESIDWKTSIQGRDWFPEESISTKNVEDALKNCEGRHIDLVVSHDCPRSFSVDEAFITRANNENFATPSRDALQTILEEVKPSFWLFGHYHIHMEGYHEGTKWQCVAKNKNIIIDTEMGFN